MKRNAVGDAKLPPFAAYRCQGSERVHVLTDGQIPPGSLLDVVRRTAVGTDRDGPDEGGAYLLQGLSEPEGALIFAVLGRLRDLPVPAEEVPDWGDRLRAAADYLQLGPAVPADAPLAVNWTFPNMSTSSLPVGLPLLFPKSFQGSFDPCMPRHCDHEVFVVRTGPGHCQLVFSTGYTRPFACVYIILPRPRNEERGVSGVPDFMRGDALATPPGANVTVLRLVHACAPDAPCYAESLTKAMPGGGSDLANLMQQLELCYDPFLLHRPTIRLRGYRPVPGHAFPLPKVDGRLQ